MLPLVTRDLRNPPLSERRRDDERDGALSEDDLPFARNVVDGEDAGHAVVDVRG